MDPPMILKREAHHYQDGISRPRSYHRHTSEAGLVDVTPRRIWNISAVVSTVPPKFLATVLLELPVPVVQGTDLASLEPARDAVEVECVLLQTRQRKQNPAGQEGLYRAALLHCRFPMRLCILR